MVLVDNGRSAMLGTEFQEMLRCIRCAACMNHCPVYGAVGGHAYGWVYPGPMGSVLTPSLIGVDAGRAICRMPSTFCGKCESVCPVKIPLPKHDAALAGAGIRAAPAARGGAQQSRRLGLVRARRPRLYRLATRVGRVGAWAARPEARPVRQTAVRRRLDRGARPAGAGGRYVLRPLRAPAAEDARTGHDQGGDARRDPARPAAGRAAGGSGRRCCAAGWRGLRGS